MHPDHGQYVHALNRIEGQVKGIRRMIEERRYCMDILIQAKAVRSALSRVEKGVFKTHLRHCVRGALSSRDVAQIDAKIEEIMALVEKQW